jgi:endonuclease YncB( thermonuclease family)
MMLRCLAPGRGASIVALVATAGLTIAAGKADSSDARRVTSFRATIAYAVDGDNLRIEEPDGDLAYVRLVGIDTPEGRGRRSSAARRPQRGRWIS